MTTERQALKQRAETAFNVWAATLPLLAASEMIANFAEKEIALATPAIKVEALRFLDEAYTVRNLSCDLNDPAKALHSLISYEIDLSASLTILKDIETGEIG